ncbi:hypothetical protein [Bradyrhizobium septentrionale]|uniref:Uncharacterized protein n=1 Tax=Bradyrhizobium septentrionale TaxID=1404411 RepID=A0ABZ2NTV1_9BRAD
MTTNRNTARCNPAPGELPRKVTTLEDREKFRRALCASDLSRVALKVALRISCHFNGRTGRCDPGIPTLAGEVKEPLRTVERAAAELKKGGWIVVEQNKTDPAANAQIHMLIPTGVPASVMAGTKTGVTASIMAGTKASECPPKNGTVTAKKRLSDRQHAGGTEEQFEQFEHERGAHAHAAQSGRVERGKTADQRADALVGPIEAQPPSASSTGTADANGSDPGTEALRRAQFLNVKMVYPPDRIGDEEVAFRAFCATKGKRPLMEIVEDVKSVVRDDNGNVPLLSDTLLTLARGQARRTGTQ